MLEQVRILSREGIRMRPMHHQQCRLNHNPHKSLDTVHLLPFPPVAKGQSDPLLMDRHTVVYLRKATVLDPQ